jgi:short-subunit dehydrogenase
MSDFSLERCAALVTGASAGIGREFAHQLAARARLLMLVARREERLQQLRAELSARHPHLTVVVRAADLSQPEEVHRLCDELEKEGTQLDLLVNNAGLGDYGAFARSDPVRDEKIMAVNVVALTLLTRRLLPQMIARRRGAIINVSSSASFLPIAGMALYAATKAFVTSFSEGLRMELRGTGVRVTALCPGPVHTEFNNVARRGEKTDVSAPEFTHVAPEVVVRSALRAIECDKALVIPGAVMKIGMAFVRAMPISLIRILARLNPRV